MFKNKFFKYFFFASLLVIGLLVTAIIQTNTGSVGKVKGQFDIGEAQKLKVIFFDVGQGDASLIITPGGEKILTDGGPDNAVVRKLGEYLPFYDKKIDYIILTHPHADHVAGLVEVLRRYQVGKIFTTGVAHSASDYLEFLDFIKEKNIPVEIIDSREEIALSSGIKINFLYPDKSFEGLKLENLNNSSIAYKLSDASTTFLFMGDLENEEYLASTTPEEIQSDVLKVGHHGSVNANDKEFLKLVSPEFAIVSVGVDNSYGLPGFRTLHELQKDGSHIFRTDENSDIVCQSDGVLVQCDGFAN
ncbi:MAG: MBL fold metallo-hydrolase [Patescibacteria group bacterium]|jgi:competence protein ComEC